MGRQTAAIAISVVLLSCRLVDHSAPEPTTSPVVPSAVSLEPSSSRVTTASVVTATALAALVCDGGATQLSADPDPLTFESYRCTSAGEQARIDLYESAVRTDEAVQTARDFYRRTGDSRGLGQIPFMCGDHFTIGVDTVGRRDALIQSLNGAGIVAGTWL